MRVRVALLLIVAFNTLGVVTSTDRLLRPLAAAQSTEPAVKRYTLVVEGTMGVRLDMLLITKPLKGVPTRDVARIVVPYAKTFDATRCQAWFDSLPEGASGRTGDTFRIVIKRNGEEISVVEGAIEGTNTWGGSLGDL